MGDKDLDYASGTSLDKTIKETYRDWILDDLQSDSIVLKKDLLKLSLNGLTVLRDTIRKKIKE